MALAVTFKNHMEADEISCCTFSKKDKIIYDEGRFVGIRTSIFSSWCCTCCERVDTNQQTWDALRREVVQRYGMASMAKAFSDPKVSKMSQKQKDLDGRIFQRIIEIAERNFEEVSKFQSEEADRQPSDSIISSPTEIERPNNPEVL